jgi:hypothetical protein
MKGLYIISIVIVKKQILNLIGQCMMHDMGFIQFWPFDNLLPQIFK